MDRDRLSKFVLVCLALRFINNFAEAPPRQRRGHALCSVTTPQRGISSGQRQRTDAALTPPRRRCDTHTQLIQNKKKLRGANAETMMMRLAALVDYRSGRQSHVAQRFSVQHRDPQITTPGRRVCRRRHEHPPHLRAGAGPGQVFRARDVGDVFISVAQGFGDGPLGEGLSESSLLTEYRDDTQGDSNLLDEPVVAATVLSTPTVVKHEDRLLYMSASLKLLINGTAFRAKKTQLTFDPPLYQDVDYVLQIKSPQVAQLSLKREENGALTATPDR